MKKFEMTVDITFEAEDIGHASDKAYDAILQAINKMDEVSSCELVDGPEALEEKEEEPID